MAEAIYQTLYRRAKQSRPDRLVQGKLMWLEETMSSGMVPEDESTSRMELVDNGEHL
jgi:hypothetical protein